jgi:hypothetical protein
MEKNILHGLNAKYNCNINLCVEDILNLKDCLETSKKFGREIGVDLYPFTLQHIINQWEKKIGKPAEECHLYEIKKIACSCHPETCTCSTYGIYEGESLIAKGNDLDALKELIQQFD